MKRRPSAPAGPGGPGRRTSGERGGRNVAAARRGAARGRRWAIACVAVLALAAAALWLVRGHAPHEPAAVAPDPAAGLDPRSAFVRALDLGTRGRHTESIPFFRRALDGGPVPSWLLHRDLAAALQNSAIEVRSLGPLSAPVTRASVERVAMIREALHEFDEAESLAPDAVARAKIAVLRGRLLEF